MKAKVRNRTEIFTGATRLLVNAGYYWRRTERPSTEATKLGGSRLPISGLT